MAGPAHDDLRAQAEKSEADGRGLDPRSYALKHGRDGRD